MTNHLAQAAGFVAIAVLLGLCLQSVLHLAGQVHHERRRYAQTGVLLVILGVAAVIVAVVRFGQAVTFGATLTMVGVFACAVGVLLVAESRDA